MMFATSAMDLSGMAASSLSDGEWERDPEEKRERRRGEGGGVEAEVEKVITSAGGSNGR